MRIFGRSLGWIFALAALGILAWEFWTRDPATGIQFRRAGEIWYQLHRGSLNLLQAVIERYVWPTLWDPVLTSLLQLPVIIFPLIPAIVLLALCYWPIRRDPSERQSG